MDTIIQPSNVPEKKSSKFVHVSIIIGIVIVLNLFSNYAVSLIFKEPLHDAYVPPTQVVEDVTTKDKCLATGGQWTENAFPVEKGRPTIQGYCNVNYTNELNYQKARKAYEKKVFITLIAFAVFLFVLAGFVSIYILSIAFSWGGVLSLLIASIRYWSLADSVFKVFILGFALVLLIWLAVKKFSK